MLTISIQLVTVGLGELYWAISTMSMDTSHCTNEGGPVIGIGGFLCRQDNSVRVGEPPQLPPNPH